MSETCEPHHNLFNALLSTGLILGLFASYLPQHLKIYLKKSSEGFSPWFLVLGATGSAGGMLNMWTLQWGVVKCCRKISAGACLESMGGLIQVTLQCILFDIILVLFMIYYPPHLKYAVVDLNSHDSRREHQVKTNVKTEHWKTSIILSWVTLVHLLFCTFVTFFLVLTTVPEPSGTHRNLQITGWATFLGVSSAVLAAIQYYPQLMHTYNLKLVGALSITTMVIQSPGAWLMVISIALRPGTDWTSWIMFAVSGTMQAILLVMCLFWKARQHRLNIDDFGHPLPTSVVTDADSTPVLRPGDAPVEAVHDNVEQAMAEDVHDVIGASGSSSRLAPDEENATADESTPLLKKRQTEAEEDDGFGDMQSKSKGWFGWFRR